MILGNRGFDTRRGRLLSRRGTSSILVGSDDYYIVDGKAILTFVYCLVKTSSPHLPLLLIEGGRRVRYPNVWITRMTE